MAQPPPRFVYANAGAGYAQGVPQYQQVMVQPVASDSRYIWVIVIGIILLIVVMAMIWWLFTRTIPDASILPGAMLAPLSPSNSIPMPSSVPVVNVGSSGSGNNDSCTSDSNSTHDTDREDGSTHNTASSSTHDTSSSSTHDTDRESDDGRSNKHHSITRIASNTSGGDNSRTRNESLKSSGVLQSTYSSDGHSSRSNRDSDRRSSTSQDASQSGASRDSSQSSSSQSMSYFGCIHPKRGTLVDVATLPGDVNCIVVHEGCLYAHVTSDGISGVYKLRDTWKCIMPTGSNNARNAQPEFDTSASTSISKLFTHCDGYLCFSTPQTAFRLSDDGRVDKVKMEAVKDYHFSGRNVAKMNKAGNIYLDDVIARSNDRSVTFRSNTRVRAYEDNLMFATHERSLVMLDVNTSSHAVVAKNISAFDVVDQAFIVYTSGRDVSVVYPGASKSVRCMSEVRDMAASSSAVYVMY